MSARFALICVDFPAYRDGRGFTTARLLRERYHYKGPIRATGDVLQDLVFFMLRVGIDEFVLKAKEPEAAFARVSRSVHSGLSACVDGRTCDRQRSAARQAMSDLRSEARWPRRSSTRAEALAAELEGKSPQANS